MAHENCDSCNEDYDFTPETARIHVYPSDTPCNHVQATCPHCGALERVFLSAESLVNLLGLKLPLYLSKASDELRAHAASLWGEQTEEEVPDLPSFALPPSLMDLVVTFAQALDKCPADILYDAITTDQPRTLPERWME